MPRTQTARAARLTLDELLDHTAELIDTGGLDAVTFRALAARCHVGPATLYQYVNTKDELLGLYTDRLLSQIPPPNPHTPWQQAARAIFTAVYETLAAHVELAQILATSATPGSAAARLLRTLIDALSRDGFTAAQITTAYDCLAAYTTGFVQQQAGRQQRNPSLTELLAHTSEHDPPGTRPLTDTDRFTAGLDVVIAGLAANGRP